MFKQVYPDWEVFDAMRGAEYFYYPYAHVVCTSLMTPTLFLLFFLNKFLGLYTCDGNLAGQLR